MGANTKSGRGCRARLTRRASAALKEHRKGQLEERLRLSGPWRDRNLVFASETGSPLNPSNLRNRSFKRVKARSGVREDLRFHDLRHTCATLLFGEGVNAKVVSEILGHASITITLNTYSHVLPDMQDTAADAMESALGTSSRKGLRSGCSTFAVKGDGGTSPPPTRARKIPPFAGVLEVGDAGLEPATSSL